MTLKDKLLLLKDSERRNAENIRKHLNRAA